MAKYTTQLRTIVEAKHPIFDFDYPVFDEAYRPVLEQKIINRYYFREIGFETVGQFKWFLKTKLNEIMPYYNERYLALEVFKTYNPYENKNLVTTEKRSSEQSIEGVSDSTGSQTGVSSGNNTSDTVSDGTANEVFSDTPQGKLSGLDYATTLTDKEEHATSKTTNDSHVENSENTSAIIKNDSAAKSTDDYIQTIRGFDGMKYASEVYEGVKDTIVNLDLLILDELNELFMNIY